VTRREWRQLLDERFGTVRQVSRERLIFPPRAPKRDDPDLGTDHNGGRYCRRCPLPEGHSVHTMPKQSREVSEVESRRLGERNEG
jgi:hypothetical protein